MADEGAVPTVSTDKGAAPTAAPKHPPSTVVSNLFTDADDADRAFTGVVISHDVDKDTYLVRYKDDDKVELEEVELAAILVAGKATTAVDIDKGACGGDISGNSGSDSNNAGALSGGDSNIDSGSEVVLTRTELELAQRLSDEVAVELFNGRDDLDDFGEVTSDFNWAVREMALTVREARGVDKATKGWLDTESIISY